MQKNQLNSNGLPKSNLPPQVSNDDVYKQLEKILNSNALCKARLLKEFLRYVVSALLERAHETIKEYQIAVEVLGRNQSFDPRLDPIVRVEASRLRARMKQYRETEGRDDWLAIQLPKGGYMPMIEVVRPHPGHPTELSFSNRPEGCTNQVSVALLPFLNLGAVPASQFLCDALTEELIDMLTDVKGFRVAPRVSVSQFKDHPDDVQSIGKRLGVSFLLEGSARHSEDRLHVKLRLIHAGTGFGRPLGTFERMAHDFATAQRDICCSIISRLKTRLLGGTELYYSAG